MPLGIVTPEAVNFWQDFEYDTVGHKHSDDLARCDRTVPETKDLASVATAQRRRSRYPLQLLSEHYGDLPVSRPVRERAPLENGALDHSIMS
jgi:hypothetical protein